MSLRLGAVLGTCICSFVAAQSQSTPPEITPPAGQVLVFAARATGTQNYICLPSVTGGGTDWVFLSPQATLSVPAARGAREQVATHFLSPVPGQGGPAPSACSFSSETGAVSCPTWQSSFDSSAVWGEKMASVTAGTDRSCPNQGAIACLLLKAIATRPGQRGGTGLLSRTTYIQRLHTAGGSAPIGSCNVGDQALVPYQATYRFYSADRR